MGQKNDQVIAHLGKRVGELSDRCQTLARLCNDESGKAAKARLGQRQAEDRADHLQAELERRSRELSAAVSGAIDLKADLKNDLSELRAAHARLEVELMAEVQKRESAETDLARLRRMAKRLIDQLEQQKAELLAEREAAERLLAMHTSARSRNGILSELRGRCDRLENDLAELRTTHARLEGSYVAQGVENDRLEAIRVQVVATNHDLLNSLARLEREKAELLAKVADMERVAGVGAASTISSQQGEIVDLRVANAALRVANAALVRENAELHQ
jgi:chromosome segregation ATPase